MSEVTQAVLRMPPSLWDGSEIDVLQRHGRYVEAAEKLEQLEAENERLLMSDTEQEYWQLWREKERLEAENQRLKKEKFAVQKWLREKDRYMAENQRLRKTLKELQGLVGYNSPAHHAINSALLEGSDE